MIIGCALLATWGGVKNRVPMIAGATPALGALSAARGLSTPLFAFLAFELIVGLVLPSFTTTSMTVLQETAEPQIQGRVFGFVGFVTAIEMPIGFGVCALLADRFTVESVLVESVLVASGVVMLGVVMLVVVMLVVVMLVVVAVALPSGHLAMVAAHEQA